jgi:hypothetical protein
MALTATITGASNIISGTIRETVGFTGANGSFVCADHTLALGDEISITLGNEQNGSGVVLANATVKNITDAVPEFTYEIEFSDLMAQVGEAYIAPVDPDDPFEADNIEASALVQSLLTTYAGVSSFDLDPTIFTFGVPKPTPIKLVSCLDAIENIAKITSRMIYTSGSTFFFKDRRPYIVGGDVAAYAIPALLKGSWNRSTKNLRNRVVVYGTTGVRAEASAVSPYVPAGLYRTAVIGHELIADNTQAQATADTNLEWMNRLTEVVSVTVNGLYTARARDIVSLTNARWGFTDTLFFTTNIEHSWGPGGYNTVFTLVR